MRKDLPPIQPYERTAHYYETDRMGIIHHSNYIRWFEETRIHYLCLLYTSDAADEL
mgnify:CR=1 FL=1